MTRGEIWWVDLGIPFGSEPGYKRPVLIIQDNSFNESNINTIIVVPLTTNLNIATAPGNVLLSRKDTNLSKDSVVNVSQIVTLDRERFINKASELKIKNIKKVEEGIKLVLSLE
ncbi:type II toxin-antitoxin system PemK/MazF family toxin [Leptospira bourretii]|uniref:mRNA interferase n=1 Tax=Leptospira bourretii TaxID=2484962 RepID=A0A4V6QLJ9_9LEPT|nr:MULTISPECIES: type II toxin-antitoxin system PemK/MazF family toxin [Leptospira]MCG6142690.1 type II toxin-antitoxin system PemK/MazF family toxin [Leptospira mtsangambouensis]TGK88547.1 type II toxin-antitoxin system PemK/MazF family toxin [Leptospira bourretii]TGK89193.1 type II toxin-antitoxin system PemK/MazF family toxin [Leptospira bourretii]TGL19804.1 type II toxin-antitoxin system PemK/MazF family toxin [Leptospira bourretii]TGL26395.1 type II toxin-antitoxin system PemK/MazF family